MSISNRQFHKAVKQAIDKSDVYPDRMVARKDGSMEIRRSYFYRFTSAERLAERVREALASEGVPATVTAEDRVREWPKLSEFVAIVTQVSEPKNGN